MPYSRKRLLLIGCLLISMGVVFYGPGVFTHDANAQDDSCPNSGGPCQFPADRYDGGIIMGSTFLNGNDMAYYGEYYDGHSNAEWNIQTNPYVSCNLPPGAVSARSGTDQGTGCKETALVGLDVDRVQDFWVYKTWKTSDTSISDDYPNESKYDNVNLFIQTDAATLDGPAGCEWDPRDCGLLAEVDELAAREVYFEGCGSFFGITDCASGTYYDYWVNEPYNDEEDGCGSDGDIGGITNLEWYGANANGFCLGAASPGATYLGQDFGIETIEIRDLVIKAPRYFANRHAGTNKVLTLGEPNNPDVNFYAEIRWGKGHDRAIIPPSDIDPPSDYPNAPPPEGTYVNHDTPSRSAGVSMTFPCEGNPTGHGDTDCFARNSLRRGYLKSGAYDDIYR